MSSFQEILFTFADAIAWTLALVFIVSVIHRKDSESLGHGVTLGALFSIAIFFSMSDPIVLPNGTGIYDMRYLLIGVATGLFGPVAGGISLVAALSYRIWIGGPGVDAAIVGSLTVFATCLVYFWFVSGRALPQILKSTLLSLAISCQLAAIITVPEPMFSVLMMSLGPYMVVSSLLGAFFLNYLLSGELSFVSRAEALEIEANTDHLTGLLNRRGIDLLYPRLLEGKGAQNGQAILCFDIDRFKATNDSFGHAAGDELLCHVVDHVAASLRHNDTFVRLGGDEFAVILPDIDMDEAEAIAERCRAIVAGAEFIAGRDVIRASISVGAVWLRSPVGFERMLSAADEALYQAKADGRNAVVFLRGLRDAGGLLGRDVAVAQAS